MNAPAAAAEARGRWFVWLAIAALGWFLFRQLSLEWRINPQYSYGWVVPALALYLVAERWRNRPEPEASFSRPIIFAALLLAIAPVRLAQEANPDWRLTSWLACGIVVGLLWTGFLYAGGRAWWRHFSFATAFLLVGAPWPTPLENILVQSLMHWVAAIGVEVLNWFGIAAAQEGNLIRLTGGALGIDEACSGVRSFQATIMAALFLGELHRLPWARRGALLLAGVVLALGLNLVRAIGLAVAAGREGLAAVQRWHDPAGYFVLAVTFFGLLFIARAMGGKGGRESVPVTRRGRLPARGAVIVLAWLAVVETSTIGWYRWHERDQAPQARWTVSWPEDKPVFSHVEIAEGTKLVLRYNQGEAAIWNRGDGSQWHLFFFSWKPGRAAANLARNHRPETCLPATGYEFVESRGVENIRAGGIDLPIERLEFKHAGQRWHVYYCLWEDRAPRPDDASRLLTRGNRLRAILEGRRHLGQRALEVVIAGIDSPERADEEFAAALKGWVKLLPP